MSFAVSPAAATYPGASNGTLAFGIKGADGNGQINVVEPDGTGVKALTSGAFNHLCAAYNADGSKIAYCSNETGAFEIWTMAADGTGQAQLTKLGGFATFPDFSPDGSLVAFGGTSGTDTHSEILTVDTATGGTVTALTSCADGKPGCGNAFPAWSPDGSQIAWIHTPDTDSNGDAVGAQVWVMNADGSNAHALTTDAPNKDQLPDWSPDGTRIAYESGPGGSGAIWVMNADGSDQHLVLGCTASDPAPCAKGDYGGPAWSPDGQQIAFLSFPADSSSDRPVMVMNADGSNPHRVIATPSFDYVPAWQPLGTSASSASGSGAAKAPAWVTGKQHLGNCTAATSDTSEPGVTHNRDFLCEPQPFISSDPRLAGTVVGGWNEDIYQVPGNAPMDISAGWLDVQNADGSWHCTWDASFVVNTEQPIPGATVTFSCVGAGAYEGLSAILALDAASTTGVPTYTGVIFPGDVPPVPQG
jgi:TolB protein